MWHLILAFLAAHPLFGFLPVLGMAAGAPVVTDAGGDAGGGEGGDAGGEGGDDGGGADAGEGGEAAGDGEADAGADAADGETGGEDAEGTEGETGSAKKSSIERTVEKSLKELKKSNPIAARVLRREHFQNQQYRELGDLNTLRDTITAFTELGGRDGVQSMQQEVKDYAEELTHMAEGNPAAIENLAKDFPKGLAKLTPLAVEKLAQIAPEAHQKLVAKLMNGALEKAKVYATFDRLEELIADGKQKEALALAQSLQRWRKSTEEFGTAPDAAPAEDERDRAVADKEKALTQKEHNIYRGQVAQSVTTELNKIVAGALAPFMNGKKLTLEQKRSLARDCYTGISDILKDNREYQSRLAAQIEQNESPSAIARFVAARAKSIASKAAKQAWSERGFSSNDASGKANSAGGQRTAAQMLDKQPRPEDIDWSKDRNRKRFMGGGITGEATLKNGKVVKWKW